jgi:hypothetical protein
VIHREQRASVINTDHIYVRRFSLKVSCLCPNLSKVVMFQDILVEITNITSREAEGIAAQSECSICMMSLT